MRERGVAATHLEDGVSDDLGVDCCHSIDRLAAHHSQVGHVDDPAHCTPLGSRFGLLQSPPHKHTILLPRGESAHNQMAETQMISIFTAGTSTACSLGALT